MAMQQHLKLTILLSVSIALLQGSTRTVRFIYTTMAAEQEQFVLGFVALSMNFFGNWVVSFVSHHFISWFGLRGCLIIGAIGHCSACIAALGIYFIESVPVLWISGMLLYLIAGMSQGLWCIAQGTYMSVTIADDVRAMMLGYFFAGNFIGSLAGGMGTYFLLMIMSPPNTVLVLLIVTIMGSVPCWFLIEAAPTVQYAQLPAKESTQEPVQQIKEVGVWELFALWSFIGLINSYMMSVQPFFVSTATNGTEEENLLNVTLIISSANFGGLAGSVFSGWINGYVGESGTVGISIIVLLWGLWPTIYLTQVPYTLWWVPAAFMVGANDGMAQTIGLKIGSIISKTPQNVFKKTRFAFGFFIGAPLIIWMKLLLMIPSWCIILGIIIWNISGSLLAIKGHQEFLNVNKKHKKLKDVEDDAPVALDDESPGAIVDESPGAIEDDSPDVIENDSPGAIELENIEKAKLVK